MNVKILVEVDPKHTGEGTPICGVGIIGLYDKSQTGLKRAATTKTNFETLHPERTLKFYEYKINEPSR